MNENAHKWVEALRSGKFHQTRGQLRDRLRDGDAYCCLGVACELFRRETGRGKWIGPTDFRASATSWSGAALPEPVMQWVGLKTGSGAYGAPSGDSFLTNDNDHGQTFEQIAATIDSEPPNLFA